MHRSVSSSPRLALVIRLHGPAPPRRRPRRIARKLDRAAAVTCERAAATRTTRVIIRLRDGVDRWRCDVIRRVAAAPAHGSIRSTRRLPRSPTAPSMRSPPTPPCAASTWIARWYPSSRGDGRDRPPLAGACGENIHGVGRQRRWCGARSTRALMPHRDLEAAAGANDSRPRLVALRRLRQRAHDARTTTSVTARTWPASSAATAPTRPARMPAWRPGTSLLSLKVLDGSGRGTISTAIQAIDYAIANRVRSTTSA